MGKLDANSSINHFSHQHPLKTENSVAKATCLACDKSVSGSLFYTCVSCNFYLHKTCSNLPRTIKHQSHESHGLVLLSTPAYPEGVFNCNACGSNGSGFSYHCPDCQIDLHVVCASMSPSVDHVAHGHKLALCFRPPYENQGFSCDVCTRPGSNHWLYRCDSCDFDAHLECATGRTILPKSTSFSRCKTPLTPPQRTARPPPPPAVKIYYSAPAQSPQVLSRTTSLPAYETHHFSPRPSPPPPPPPPPVQPYYAATGVPQYVQSPRQDTFMNNMAGHAVEGLVGSVAQEILQSVFQGMFS